MACSDPDGFKWQIEKIFWFCRAKFCVIIWQFRESYKIKQGVIQGQIGKDLK
jgi:hypothetical protein